MPNLAKVLKEEIGRIARSQTKQITAAMRRDSIWLKRVAAQMKRRVTSLERDNRLLKAQVARQVRSEMPNAEELKQMRLSGRMIRSLRGRLNVSQVELGRLLGVSGQSVYQWERRPGSLRLREETKMSLFRVRKMGAREARAELEGDKQNALPATKKKVVKRTKRKVAKKKVVKRAKRKVAKKKVVKRAKRKVARRK